MTLPSAQKQQGLHGTVSVDAHDRRQRYLAARDGVAFCGSQKDELMQTRKIIRNYV